MESTIAVWDGTLSVYRFVPVRELTPESFQFDYLYEGHYDAQDFED